MDAFDLFIVADKLKTSNKFDFLAILKVFEIYIGITGFLRNYIFYYV